MNWVVVMHSILHIHSAPFYDYLNSDERAAQGLAELGRYLQWPILWYIPKLQSHISVAFCVVFHHCSFTSFHKSHVSPIKPPLPPGIFPERSLGSVISFQFSLTTPFFPSHMATFPLYSPVGKLSFSLYWILTMCVASDFLY